MSKQPQTPRVGLFCPEHPLKADLTLDLTERGFDVKAYDTPGGFLAGIGISPGTVGIVVMHTAVYAKRVIAECRSHGVNNPILAIIDTDGMAPDVAATAKAKLLHAGADDAQGEADIPATLLDARVLALARRTREPEMDSYSMPGCKFYPGRGVIEMDGGGTVGLTVIEGGILSLLASRSGLVTKQTIMDVVYQGRDEPQIKIVDVFVCKLRKKIQRATGGLDVIETVWSQGYRMVPKGFTKPLKEAA
jgi:two-component system cell cycle response regulator CtrA